MPVPVTPFEVSVESLGTDAVAATGPLCIELVRAAGLALDFARAGAVHRTDEVLKTARSARCFREGVRSRQVDNISTRERVRHRGRVPEFAGVSISASGLLN